MAITWVSGSIFTVPVQWGSFEITREVNSEKTFSSITFKVANDDAGFSFYIDNLSLVASVEDLPEPVIEEEAITGAYYAMRFPEVGQGSAYECPIFAPYEEAKINNVLVVFKEAVTGADGNYFSLQLVNKGTDGSGTDKIVDHVFISGEDASANVVKNLTVNTNYSAMEQAATVTLKKVESGSGMKMPEGLLIIFWSSNITMA